MSIQHSKLERIIGLIFQVVAITVGMGLVVAGVMHPEALAYVLQAMRRDR